MAASTKSAKAAVLPEAMMSSAALDLSNDAASAIAARSATGDALEAAEAMEVEDDNDEQDVEVVGTETAEEVS